MLKKGRNEYNKSCTQDSVIKQGKGERIQYMLSRIDKKLRYRLKSMSWNKIWIFEKRKKDKIKILQMIYKRRMQESYRKIKEFWSRRGSEGGVQMGKMQNGSKVRGSQIKKGSINKEIEGKVFKVNQGDIQKYKANEGDIYKLKNRIVRFNLNRIQAILRKSEKRQMSSAFRKLEEGYGNQEDQRKRKGLQVFQKILGLLITRLINREVLDRLKKIRNRFIMVQKLMNRRQREHSKMQNSYMKHAFQQILYFTKTNQINRLIPLKLTAMAQQKNNTLQNQQTKSRLSQQIIQLRTNLEQQTNKNYIRKLQFQKSPVLKLKNDQNNKNSQELQQLLKLNTLLTFIKSRKTQTQSKSIAPSNQPQQFQAKSSYPSSNYSQNFQSTNTSQSFISLNKPQTPKLTHQSSNFTSSPQSSKNIKTSVSQSPNFYILLNTIINILQSQPQQKQVYNFRQFSIILQRSSIDITSALNYFIQTQLYQTILNLDLKNLLNLYEKQIYKLGSDVPIIVSKTYQDSFDQNIFLRELIQNLSQFFFNFKLNPQFIPLWKCKISNLLQKFLQPQFNSPRANKLIQNTRNSK